jgi:hypothetical protein
MIDRSRFLGQFRSCRIRKFAGGLRCEVMKDAVEEEVALMLAEGLSHRIRKFGETVEIELAHHALRATQQRSQKSFLRDLNLFLTSLVFRFLPKSIILPYSVRDLIPESDISPNSSRKILSP